MKTVKEKIKRFSKTVSIALLAGAGLMTFAMFLYLIQHRGFYAQVFELGDTQAMFRHSIWIIGRIGLILLLVYGASVFRAIEANENPFVAAIPRRMKKAAVFLFFTVAIPQWMYTLLDNSAKFALFDQTTGLVLILSVTICCFAQFYEYGYLLQDENDEIL